MVLTWHTEKLKPFSRELGVQSLGGLRFRAQLEFRV